MKKNFGPLPTRYARSLFLAAKQGNVVSEVEKDLQALDETFSQYGEFTALMLNPGLSDEKLSAILTALSSKLNLHPVTRRFIDLLHEKRRLELLATIPAYYHELYLEDAGEIEAGVTTAIELDSAGKEKIQVHLAKKTGKKPLISWTVNPQILGGLVMEWSGTVYDGSLARKLRELENRMVEAV
ncbi:ATP synthase F1 subunit delta [bacterium]|nr:ATP synthase F1 subunit delta [bacterium]